MVNDLPQNSDIASTLQMLNTTLQQMLGMQGFSSNVPRFGGAGAAGGATDAYRYLQTSTRGDMQDSRQVAKVGVSYQKARKAGTI